MKFRASSFSSFFLVIMPSGLAALALAEPAAWRARPAGSDSESESLSGRVHSAMCISSGNSSDCTARDRINGIESTALSSTSESTPLLTGGTSNPIASASVVNSLTTYVTENSALAAPRVPHAICASALSPVTVEQRPDGAALSVLTYNICAITHPFSASSAALIGGLALGLDLTDSSRDVSIDSLGSAGRERIARHAKYIRASGADIVMLQEVAGKSVLDELVRCLGGEYDSCHATCAPSMVAVLIWVVTTLLIAALSFCIFEGAATLLLGSAWLAALSGGRLLRYGLVTCVSAWRWRHSIMTQFPLGSVAGQVAFLRRRECTTCGPLEVKGFIPFDDHIRQLGASVAAGDAPPAPAPGWLEAFFAIRPRGVLSVRAPLNVLSEPATPSVVAPNAGELLVMNTHMPHGCDNRLVWHGLAELIDGANAEACIVFGGDLNPLPHVPVDEQLRPLLARGIRPTNALIKGADDTPAEFITWDLQQPLTRRCEGETPRDMQLDFVLVRAPKPGASLVLQPVHTSVVGRGAFYEPGSPLSDHYALMAKCSVAMTASLPSSKRLLEEPRSTSPDIVFTKHVGLQYTASQRAALRYYVGH